MRQAIGARMLESLQTAATCTTVVEADLVRIEAARAKTGFTYLPYIARATIDTLREFPQLNATLEDDTLTTYDGVHLGIAVSLGEGGLIVPVIRDAQELSVEGLATRIKDLARRGRANELTPDEVRGGSFTITNPGGYGSIIATPVINQPQVAILDTEAVVKRPVVITDELGNDSIAIRPMTYLCMSWDHRALDGALAAQVPERAANEARVLADQREMRELWTCHLGEVEYREAVALQERLRARVQAGELPDLLLLLEHPPVYTLGRRSEPGELPVRSDIDVVETERGGKLTYHGPGQLVGYPIMHVPNVRAFVETMERALIDAIRAAGVPAGTREGRELTGVWVEDRKIASIGIHVSRRVSMHGFAVNVENDLDPFGSVIACGLPDVKMTSLQAEGSPEGIDCFRKRAAYAFAQAFGRRQRIVTPRRLATDP